VANVNLAGIGIGKQYVLAGGIEVQTIRDYVITAEGEHGWRAIYLCSFGDLENANTAATLTTAIAICSSAGQIGDGNSSIAGARSVLEDVFQRT
jgi:hypothetical protein